MSFASPPLPPTASAIPVLSPTERRLWAEWDLLQSLASRNPHRLTDLGQQDDTFLITLRQTTALAVPQEDGKLAFDHRVRIVFPQFFPAVPMELYLHTAIFHPNVHPHTGFVCLWDRHRVSNNVEHALHKLVAILGWRLYNAEATHVMQDDALRFLQASGDEVRATLDGPGLLGVMPSVAPSMQGSSTFSNTLRRRRLS